MSVLKLKSATDQAGYADKVAEAKEILEDAKEITGEFLLMATVREDGDLIHVTKGAAMPAFYLSTFVNFCKDNGMLEHLINHAITQVGSRQRRRQFDRQAEKGGVAR